MSPSRPILALWAQLGFRILPALLLLINLGFMLYCSATFSESLIIGYVLNVVLLLLCMPGFIRLRKLLMHDMPSPTRKRIGDLLCLDSCAFILAGVLGIWLFLEHGSHYECTIDECHHRSDPASTWLDTGAYLLWAVSGLQLAVVVLGLVQFCTARAARVPNPSVPLAQPPQPMKQPIVAREDSGQTPPHDDGFTIQSVRYQ